jgi:hypothetical protein
MAPVRTAVVNGFHLVDKHFGYPNAHHAYAGAEHDYVNA